MAGEKYLGSELDEGEEDTNGPSEDSPIHEDAAQASCWLTVDGRRRRYSPGARACWGNNIIVCQKNGSWHNSRRRC